VKPTESEASVMVCDDSEDHHDHKGFVVGLTNGSVQFREKLDFYKMSIDTVLEIGQGSAADELKCMRAD